MSSRCPSCEDSFDSMFAVKVHHKLSHGESLVEETSTCSVHGCENTFSYYPSEKDGTLCPECVSNGKNVVHTDNFSKEDISPPDTSVEHIDVICTTCEKEYSIIPSRNRSDNHFCSRSCLDEYNSKRMSGENNPRYVDGDSLSSSYDKDWRSVKRKSLKRDNFACCICSNVDDLHVHHLKPVRTFDNPKDAHFLSNTITLCSTCHPKVEHGNKKIPESLLDEKELVDPEVIY